MKSLRFSAAIFLVMTLPAFAATFPDCGEGIGGRKGKIVFEIELRKSFEAPEYLQYCEADKGKFIFWYHISTVPTFEPNHYLGERKYSKLTDAESAELVTAFRQVQIPKNDEIGRGGLDGETWCVRPISISNAECSWSPYYETAGRHLGGLVEFFRLAYRLKNK